MKNELRSEKHKKNSEVEEILKELEMYLSPIQAKINESIDTSLSHPVIFIVGCARSGTTMAFQTLARTKNFCYPTNLMSRFYYAPYIGAKLQQLLVEFDYKKEIFQTSSEKNQLYSELGKTIGASEPHEFWYFWRRYFKFKEVQKLERLELNKVDWNGFIKDLNSIQQVFDKPLIMKGMILNWNLSYLAKKIPNSYFLFIKREVTFNAQSLLKAREDFGNDIEKWYSFKPLEYAELKKLPPEEQVVKQVQYTNKAITQELKNIPQERVFTIRYDEFCKETVNVVNNLFKILGMKSLADGSIPPLEIKNKIKVSMAQWQKIEQYARE